MTSYAMAPAFIREGDGTAYASLHCDTVDDPKSQCSNLTLPHRRTQILFAAKR
jgi:hypothetical protein